MFHQPLTATKRQGVPANMYVHVELGLRTTFATLSVAGVCVADFAKPSPAALDMAFTVGHDRVLAHGSAAIAPAMTSSNTGISNCGGRRLARCGRLALRGVRPPAGIPEQM